MYYVPGLKLVTANNNMSIIPSIISSIIPSILIFLVRIISVCTYYYIILINMNYIHILPIVFINCITQNINKTAKTTTRIKLVKYAKLTKIC